MSRLLPPPRRLTRGIALALGIPFFVGLALLTLTPERVEKSMPNLLDLVLSAAHRLGWESLDFTRLEIIANVLVFVPIGILAFLLVPRRFWPLRSCSDRRYRSRSKFSSGSCCPTVRPPSPTWSRTPAAP